MEIYFELAGEVVIVRIRNNNVDFSTINNSFGRFVPIDCLKLDVSGILKEFPDLKGKKDGEIKSIAIKRFKEHIKKLENENQVKSYVINELGKSGYVPKIIKREGFRTQKIR